MKFVPLAVAGAFEILPDRREDERGFFARTFCGEEFAARGLAAEFPQCSMSVSKARGTLRGLHFQRSPHGETKLVRCTRGAVRDVVLDLRLGSPTFKRWAAIDLDPRSANAAYVPEGCAHGFLTLEDESEVHYMMSAPYHAASEAGVRWNDPAFAIDWRDTVRVISGRDREFPDYLV